jgi:hypothetical protein
VIQEVRVKNMTSQLTCVMELMQPNEEGFIILGIDGLGPPKSNINIRANANMDGSTFNSSIIPTRNIVFTLKFAELADITIEQLRWKTYSFFPLGDKVRIEILSDKGTFYTIGYVESNEPTIFSKEEGTVISIICPDPFFIGVEGAGVGDGEGSLITYTKLFTFPFSNESENAIIKFGEREYLMNMSIYLGSTVNVGPTIILSATGEVNMIIILFKL